MPPITSITGELMPPIRVARYCRPNSRSITAAARVELVGFAMVRLDLADAAEDLLGAGREAGHLGLAARGDGAGPGAHPADRQGRERQADQGERGELPVAPEHQPDQEQDGQEVAGDGGQARRHGGAQQLRVVDQAGDQRPRAAPGHVADIGPDHVVEQAALQIGDDALAGFAPSPRSGCSRHTP